MAGAKHAAGPWEAHPAIHGQEGIAFVIYPTDTSEPLAEVLARDGAAEIALKMAAASELLQACQAMIAWDGAEKNAKPFDEDGGADIFRRIELGHAAFEAARAAIAKATGSAS